MNTLEIYKKLDRDIRLNYDSVAEFARLNEVSRQRMGKYLKTLKSNNDRNSINILFKVLEKAGYKITIEKINRDL